MSNPLSVKILFAGGGTGGHLYPALAIANRIAELLKDRAETDIAFVGTKRGLEYRLGDELGYPLYLISMRGITRSLTLKNLFVPFMVLLALIQSAMLLSKFRPDMVVGTGGYVSWPVLKMAAVLGILTVLQEQNSFPGVATRSAAARAKRIYLGFEEAKTFLKSAAPMIVTGNPVRAEIANGSRQRAYEHFKLNPNKKTILVLGGSQGAHAINNAVIKSLEKNNWAGDAQLLWQSGTRDYKEVKEKTAQLNWDGALFPFAANMADVYAASDVVIARAGALTLAELIECNLPSILIPFPYAAGDHQKKNALSLSSHNRAVLVDENQLGELDVLNEAVQLLKSEKYTQIKSALSELIKDRKPAVEIIADDIVSLIGDSKEAGSEN